VPAFNNGVLRILSSREIARDFSSVSIRRREKCAANAASDLRAISQQVFVFVGQSGARLQESMRRVSSFF